VTAPLLRSTAARPPIGGRTMENGHDRCNESSGWSTRGQIVADSVTSRARIHRNRISLSLFLFPSLGALSPPPSSPTDVSTGRKAVPALFRTTRGRHFQRTREGCEGFSFRDSDSESRRGSFASLKIGDRYPGRAVVSIPFLAIKFIRALFQT